jgi:subtilisin family serine protease
VILKLQLDNVHRIAQGNDVLVALIDSQIDRQHPDLRDAIAERYDAGCGTDQADPHGTGMASAIASRAYLRGVAPRTRILAICAFGGSATSAQSTTMQIIRGIDYAVGRGARIINMSFAGPHDPMLERALRNAHDKGVSLIAAVGNEGPKSPPLYPGADPAVIAVTATDMDDHVFARANHGKYIAVAAPGVDVMVDAPGSGYTLTTGTSVAAANVSGVAALLMEIRYLTAARRQ